MKYIGWIQLVLGLWVLASPWILGFSYINVALWSSVIAGILIVIISLWELFGKSPESPKNF